MVTKLTGKSGRERGNIKYFRATLTCDNLPSFQSILTMISSWPSSHAVRFWFLHQRVLDLCPGQGALQPSPENPRARKSFLLFVKNLIIDFSPRTPSLELNSLWQRIPRMMMI